jgi:hypothetical protein
MQFQRTVRLDSPLDEVWALTDELETVAGCIPGVSGFEMVDDRSFRCRLVQKVGAVTADFRLHSELRDVHERESLTVASQGKDDKLHSTVRATQTFTFRADGDTTEVDIAADVHVTGRIATFGGRLIPAIAERVTVETLENVSDLLDERRRAGTS